MKNKHLCRFSLLIAWFAVFIFFGNAVNAQSINRSQVIQNAEAYQTHNWQASSSNIKNDVKCGGKRIRTPNWVKVGSNKSLPYCWGGNTALSSFNARMAEGKCAGDNRTISSGYGFGAEPSCTAGVDCSGFVCRSLGRSGHTATSGLNGISNSTSWGALKPGDFVNKPGSHTRLVHTPNANGTITMIESSRSYDKVHYRTYSSASHSSYYSRRYKNIQDGPTNPPPPGGGGGGGDCDAVSNTITGTIPAGTYETSSSITSTGTISSGMVTFRSKTITLNEGFTVDGGTFYAENADCSGNNKEDQQALYDFSIQPNPFNSYTQIKFTLPEELPVSIWITDMTGRHIATLANQETKSAGEHEVTFEAANYAAGMYFVTIQAEEYFGTQKMILTK